MGSLLNVLLLVHVERGENKIRIIFVRKADIFHIAPKVVYIFLFSKCWERGQLACFY